MSPTLRQMHQRQHTKKYALDVLLGRPPWTTVRYMEKDFRPVVHHQGDNMAWVDNVWQIGLRRVGIVTPEPKRDQVWQYSYENHPSGWYTNADNDTGNEGDGLAWGVVYKLSTKHRRARFLAGYFIDGWNNLLIDFGTIYSEPVDGDLSAESYASAEHAAKVADQMAEKAAEDEREYQLTQREKEQ